VDIEGVLAIILIFGGMAATGIAYSPIGKALGDRIRYGKAPLNNEPDPALYEELDHMRTEISELQERLDFAERLLAKPDGVATPEATA
jgi:hypothetical protein